MPTFLSAHAAAARLGVSDRTVRRWIAAGRLRADKAEGEFRIALEDLSALTGHEAVAAAADGHEVDDAAAPNTNGSRSGAASAAASSDSLSGLIALIERQQTQLLERAEAAAMWQARALMLEERVRALEAPRQPAPTETPVAAQQPPSTPEVALEAPAPWWRRWRAWLAAGAVLVVLGSASCQASSSVKHAGLCGVARATFDDMAQDVAGQPVTLPGYWALANSVLDAAQRVC